MGQEVFLKGWIDQIRSLGKLTFLLLRDRSGLAQIVVQESFLIKKLSSLQIGSIVSVQGLAMSAPQAALGAEIINPKIDVEVPIGEAPPVEYSKPEIPSDLEFILDHRPLSLRNRRLSAIFKIQAEIVHAYRLFMHDEVDAVEYFAPCLLGASSEGGAEFFHVDYFGHTATLAQSSQLYKQMMVGVYERVFALMPFFRAEPSHTTRHLSEGKQFEFEMGLFDDWREILDIQERCIRFILSWLKTRCSEEIALLTPDFVQVPEKAPIPRISFQEAQEIFFQQTGVDERLEPDLSPAAERALCAWAKETHGSDFVFITDWKTEKRPFYAYPSEKDPTLSNTFDLLCAGVEITSGGQRRHTYESMLEGLALKGMDPAHFGDYLSIFRYGMPPHGGFGIGLERLTMTMLRLKNIREASLFPSDTKRIAGNKIQAKPLFGGEAIRDELLRLCRRKGFLVEHLVHAPSPTSEDSAKIRGTSLEEGIKALILRGKTTGKNYQCNVPSHAKLDMKAVATLVGEKCEFEDAAIIEERFGLKVGGIPPCGSLLGLETFFDLSIQTHPRCAFNCGLLTESILMQTADLIALIDPKWGSFVKDA